MSLQREPDLKAIPVLQSEAWPKYMRPETVKQETDTINKLEKFHRSIDAGYKQSHPYDFMYPSGDLKLDEISLNNNYMKLIFGGITDPAKDNIDLAYNNSLRQMAEAPVDKDSIIGQMNPNKFVEGQQATRDSMLETFAETRKFYAGAVDTDAEKALKSRPTHNLIATTYYGKNQRRYNHVRGQNDLLNRPTNLSNFKPFENLSSWTYAPDGMGSEVPLNVDNTNGSNPLSVHVPTTDGKVLAPKTVPQAYNFTDIGNYAGDETDRYMYTFPDENPSFIDQFKIMKQRG